ncbi:TRAP transporter substrate-binding protein [Marinobacterium sp. YM272]|uniref:TRAP transporter substrate-binding protein n=1 Tax=Marinobacterium sp. YM272 TaxID=3421654 RepID=UPI003D7F458B
MKLTSLIKPLAAGVLLGLSASAAQADDSYSLRLAHFWPAGSSVDKVVNAWAERLNERSDGRLTIDIYPSQTLAKAPASYDATVNGVADITVTAQGYTAGRFPLTQVIELPGIVTSAENASCVLQNLYDEELISNEYKDTHPLFFFAHGPGHIHTGEKPVKTPEDLSGLRIRRATTVVGDLLESLGAQPVGMPAPETYTAVQRGVMNGVAFPWQAMKDFRLNEQLTQHTEIGLYTLSFITTMNNASYTRLPDDLKQVIDENSGMEWARAMGKELDDLDARGREEALKDGHSFYTVEGGTENPAWKDTLQGVIDHNIEMLTAKSLPADQVYNRAKSLVPVCAG